jgi:hypothetical protein
MGLRPTHRDESPLLTRIDSKWVKRDFRGVGIELGCVCFRRRVTTLVLSVARWVHNSAMATFSEAPLSCRTAGFPRSGWKSWPFDDEPSHLRQGSSAGTHTPQHLRFAHLCVPFPTSAYSGSVSEHHADHGTTKYPEDTAYLDALVRMFEQALNATAIAKFWEGGRPRRLPAPALFGGMVRIP